ncbi:WASH complex, subunit strumpellin [Ochromonadaceae sp. CCMP2298]|nr:WASH complex, subunit strumpellin [Ochromonadaceae sp. CCMP2298]
MDFLSHDNLCGQTLIRIVSRGAAIIAELLRLSANIPEVFLGEDKIKDPEQRKYLQVLFDFRYLREPEEFEKKINDDVNLLDLDQEFQENHQEILARFYKLFESIWKYHQDLAKYVDDVLGGFYIQHSLDNIFEEVEGKQLLCESLYLYGVMLLLMEERIPGHCREKILIAVYRLNGESGLENVEEVCKLCRNTGYVPGADGKKPKNHPEAFFNRFAPHAELVRLAIGRLQTDDVYLMATSYPNPDHRSTRLAAQASMLYVILYFAPDVLHKQKASMREVVDKYFNENWVIATYMGQVVDLTVEWATYPAAKHALDNVISASAVKMLSERNAASVDKCLESLKVHLKEGVLQQDYLLDHTAELMNCVRSCNIALRWRLLHRRAKSDQLRKIVEGLVSPQTVVALLLNTSQLEYVLKGMLQQLLEEKDLAWTEGKSQAAERMSEMSEYFTGEMALTRVKRDDNLVRWFAGLAAQVTGLNLDEDHATATGRKIQGLIAALEDVEQFEAVDTNVQIKSFLDEAREIFRLMIRTVNIKNEVMNVLENISDASYAWQTLGDYIPVFHERIRHDPSSVVLLRATFLKTASILDVPLVRIAAIDSPDAVSVAEYYSGELVEFVRLVLEIIPISVFHVLSQIVRIQTSQMKPIPIRLEAKDLKDFAQLDVRCELAKLTHQVSVFTEGTLVMQKTLLGVIQIEPRQILEEGLRRELVRQVSRALHKDLTFHSMTQQEINQNMSRLATALDGLKRSIEYLQDYIGIAGLKIFQQEFARTINYNTEQEANRFLKRKTFDSASRFQSKAIPIPRVMSTGGSVDNDEVGAVNFMGRVMSALLFLTDPTRTVYAAECSAWFLVSAPDQKGTSTTEACGIRTFALLERSIGVIGLRGLDRLLAFRTVHTFNSFLKYYAAQVHPFRTLLDQVRDALHPEHKIPTNASKLYANAVKKVEGLMLTMLKIVRKIGQGQLIRRQIVHVLQFGCQLDAHLLYQALDTFNKSLLTEVQRHYAQPEKYPYPSADNPLLFEATALLEACGLDDPMHKIYVTTHPLEGLPVLLFLFLLTYLPKLDYDANYGSLVRKKAQYPLDGAALAVGLACLLKQFHPSYTRQLMSYLGQFVRSNLQQVFSDVDTKAAEVPKDVLNVLIFMEQLCHYTSIPRSAVHEFVPAYIFDALKFAQTAGKK